LYIRPMDLQVMMPRTLDAAKTATIHEQQAVTQQQQLSVRLKQAVEAQQQQVQTKLSTQQDGKVTTEDLEREKQKERRQNEAKEDGELSGFADVDNDNRKISTLPTDPLRGHTIDIKT